MSKIPADRIFKIEMTSSGSKSGRNVLLVKKSGEPRRRDMANPKQGKERIDKGFLLPSSLQT